MIRQPLHRRSAGRGLQKASTLSLPAPVGGWNVRDPLAAMPAKDAVVLENWFPKANDVELRPGAQAWVTGFAAQPLTLMAWNGPSSSKLFASTVAGIYDVSASGAVGAPAIALTNGYLQHTNFQVAGGQYLVAVNGTDLLKLYNGVTWRSVGAGTGALASATAVGTLVTATATAAHNLQTGDSVAIAGSTPAAYNGTYTVTVLNSTQFTYTAGSAPGGAMTSLGTWTYNGIGITGLPTANLTNVAVACRRLWFVQRNSSSAWYLPVAQVGGALTEFPLGAVFGRGGYLVAIGTWTIDGGDGSDDYTVFISSEGEIAVYKGTDPASLTTFAKVGVYYVGEPISKNCFCKYGGDLLVLCQNGLFPLSKALQSATINRSAALTSKIDTAFTEEATLYSENPGWQVVTYPQGNFVLINIPVTGAYTIQYVMNSITGAWCKFTGWFAGSWAVFGKALYFASDNKIAKAWVGHSDFGAAIVGRCQQAYNTYGSVAKQKHFKLVRPLITLDGAITLQMGFDVDYAVSDFTSVTTAAPVQGYAWDNPNTKWDQVTWGPDSESKREWATVLVKECYAAAFRLQVATTSVSLKWSATDFVYEVGGVL